jgi:hypothetical protein
MAIYAGIDLHSNSNFLSVVDSAGKIIEKRKLANDDQAILHPLAPYRDQIQGIASILCDPRFFVSYPRASASPVN